MLNPVPAGLICDIFTAAFPVFVRTTCLEALLPVLMFPKLSVAGFAVSCPNGVFVPLPVSGRLTVGFAGSLLVIARFPLAEPAAVGMNVSVSAAVCPELIIFGVAIPLSENSEPVSATMETVRSAAPAFVITTFCVPCVPTLTVPKSTVALLREICCCGLTPVALRFNTTGVAAESIPTDSVPVMLPAAVGFTETEMLAACPEGSESGSAVEATVNCGLDTFSLVIVTVLWFGFVTEKVCVDCLPRPTRPKQTLLGFSCKEPV